MTVIGLDVGRSKLKGVVGEIRALRAFRNPSAWMDDRRKAAVYSNAAQFSVRIAEIRVTASMT